VRASLVLLVVAGCGDDKASPPSDGAAAADQAAAPSADLAVAAGAGDLSVGDLGAADLSAADLAVPDLAALVDQLPPVDMAAPPDLQEPICPVDNPSASPPSTAASCATT
jgi:hypothetical protein